MSTPTTYELKHISDLLDVPTERRKACVEQVLLAISFHELALGDGKESRPKSITWTDDDQEEISIHDIDGTPKLSMKMVKAAD